MILRCKCSYEEHTTIHKDGLEVVSFICKRCRRAMNRPTTKAVVVGRYTLIIKLARVVER